MACCILCTCMHIHVHVMYLLVSSPGSPLHARVTNSYGSSKFITRNNSCTHGGESLGMRLHTYLSLTLDTLHIASEEGVFRDDVHCPHSTPVSSQPHLELNLDTHSHTHMHMTSKTTERQHNTTQIPRQYVWRKIAALGGI